MTVHSSPQVGGQAVTDLVVERPSGGAPAVPDGWEQPLGPQVVPIALHGQAGQDSDEPISDGNGSETHSIETDMELAAYHTSPSKVVPLLDAVDGPVSDGE